MSINNRAALLTFYGSLAEHGIHLRTTTRNFRNDEMMKLRAPVEKAPDLREMIGFAANG
ncbi:MULTISPECIES: hypothetical protein [Bradyrhizobium]|uniref:Uncharacterized protein n=1 Tax=Bradyrhizobium zhengyangense TaxID=2911009 RepID=A0ABS9M282_9BRAD|nr:hypothetical protein [Bradyrhizobium zhengyangense]MCG2673379.1 hypothetical protein [Bradyrhizobium zhengyangense]